MYLFIYLLTVSNTVEGAVIVVNCGQMINVLSWLETFGPSASMRL